MTAHLYVAALLAGLLLLGVVLALTHERRRP